jgi:hypothetical protein
MGKTIANGISRPDRKDFEDYKDLRSLREAKEAEKDAPTIGMAELKKKIERRRGRRRI